MKKKLLVLIGRSGSGKSSIASELHRSYGLKPVCSYTDRPMRFDGEDGHTFLSKEQFDEVLASQKIVAFTVFDSNRYCTTVKQVAACDIVILDEAGLIDLIGNYCGNKKIVSAYIHADNDVCIARMINRSGGTLKAREDAYNRALCDKSAFTQLIWKNIDCIVNTTDIDVITAARYIIEQLEKEGDCI